MFSFLEIVICKETNKIDSGIPVSNDISVKLPTIILLTCTD